MSAANLCFVVMQGGEKQGKVQKLSKGEVLMLNIGSMCTGARVIAVSLKVIAVSLVPIFPSR